MFIFRDFKWLGHRDTWNDNELIEWAGPNIEKIFWRGPYDFLFLVLTSNISSTSLHPDILGDTTFSHLFTQELQKWTNPYYKHSEDKRSRGEWLELVNSATTTTFIVSTSERSSIICSVKMHYGVFMFAFVNFHHILLGEGGGKQLNTHEV